MLIKQCGQSLIIVWNGFLVPELTGYETIAYMSQDEGQSWSERIVLSEIGGHDAQVPCLTCNKTTGELAVGWMDYNYPGDLFLRLSPDGGASWEQEIHVTNHHEVFKPSLEFVGDTIWAAWTDYSIPNNKEICFTKSIDRGQTWSPMERLTYAEGSSYAPWLSYDNGKLHLVWYEEHRPPYGMTDIYYKRYEAETGIDDGLEPERITFLESYPNPFNSSTVINFSNIKGGEIKIYDICGRLLRTLNAGGGQEGKITWDATDNSGNTIGAGVYFARAATPQGFISSKLIYLK